MIMWIVSTVLTSAAAVLVAAPFIWRYAVRRSAATLGARTQADQIKPAENDGSRDPIDADRSRSSSIEIGRPPLTGDRVPEAQQLHLSKFMRPWAPAAITSGLVALGFVGIYALTRDSPPSADPASANRSVLPPSSQSDAALRDLQLFSKNLSPAGRSSDQLRQSAQVGAGVQGAPKANSGLPPVDELIGRLVARLGKNPKDIEGWRLLGWSYFNLQRFDEAAAAFAKAIELSPNVADLHSARGEALVRAANGAVTANSKLAFSEALKLNSKELRARYFIGLEKAQAGNKTAALDDWIEVANDVETNDPTVPALGQSIAELAKELNVDLTQRLRRPLDTADQRTPGQPKSPDVSLMPHTTVPSEPKLGDANAPAAPANQTDMIGEMVGRLESRLERSPRDVDGWIMLIRSKKVLNDPGAVRQAYERALKVFDERSPEHDRLVAAAKEFGLGP